MQVANPRPDAAFLVNAAARRTEKKKVAEDATIKARTGPRPSGKLVIRETQPPKPSQPVVPAVSGEKRKADMTGEESSPKKAKTDPADEIWYPSWDIRKRDSFFGPNEGGRFVNMAPFEAFLLPRDQKRLSEADVEKSFGASMGHMSRALAYFASGSSQLSKLIHQYRELEEAAKKSNKLATEAFNQRDFVQKENKELKEEMKKLKKRKS